MLKIAYFNINGRGKRIICKECLLDEMACINGNKDKRKDEKKEECADIIMLVELKTFSIKDLQKHFPHGKYHYRAIVDGKLLQDGEKYRQGNGYAEASNKGGIVIFYKEEKIEWNAMKQSNIIFRADSFEAIWLDITREKLTHRLFLCYRRGNSNNDEFIDAIQKNLNEAQNRAISYVHLFGDFNYDKEYSLTFTVNEESTILPNRIPFDKHTNTFTSQDKETNKRPDAIFSHEIELCNNGIVFPTTGGKKGTSACKCDVAEKNTHAIIHSVLTFPKRLPLTIEPSITYIPTANPTSVLKLKNEGTEKLVFNAKCSNEEDFEVLPKTAFVNTSKAVNLKITRKTDTRVNEEQLVIRFGTAPVDDNNPSSAFTKIEDEAQISTIPIKASPKTKKAKKGDK